MDAELLAKEIVAGRRLKRGEDFCFFKTCNLESLVNGADYIREKLCGNQVDLCSIISGRSGRCSENCKFCAQSVFNHTECAVYDFLDDEKIIEAAKENQREGVHKFSIVTSGKALSGEEFKKAVNVFKKIKAEVKIGLCASMGFLTKEQLLELKDAGVENYHHNIETSERNFPNICTSHTYQMKMNTLRMAKEAGLKICSGGIIGMGESFDDRIDMALSLSEIGVYSIPINVLTPIKGTPFENLPELTEDEILRTVAMFRYFNPDVYIRLAAGRKLLSDGGKKAFNGGANAAITGNMLTTTGMTIQSDKQLIKKIGRTI